VKIRAIRLKEVGRFREPIALEGLTGGLDVLAGPNELGKSTILKAVHLALFVSHTSKSKEKLEALRPYGGGAPLIEVDFEIDGDTWRIRKQFLSARAAELRNLRSGHVARGGDAEAELERLLAGKDGRGRFALLWVDQGASLAPFNPAATAGGSLMAAIENEVESVADGGMARLVQTRLKDELGELVTSHAPPRPAGRYKAALEEHQALERQREDACSHLAGAEARLDRLQVIRRDIAQLSDPAAASRRAQAAATAKLAYQEAREARDKCRHAEEAVRAQEERLGALKATLDEIEGKITDLAKLEEAERSAGPALDELNLRKRDTEAKASEFRRRCDEIRSALTAAEQERKAVELAARLREVRERLEGARAASAERKSAADALGANAADEGLLAAVRREAQSLATIEARLSAAAPRVLVAYARGGQGKIKVEGRALNDGETFNPTKPTMLEIEGVGTVTIAPGQSESVAEDEADIAAHRKELSGLLRRIGAASVDEAEQRAAARRTLEGKLAEAGAHLKALAPDGLERLERVHAELAAVAAAAKGTAGAIPAPADLAARLQTLTTELAAADTQLSQMVHAHGQAREALVQLRTRSEERRNRIEALVAGIGDMAARVAKRQKGHATVAAAEADLNRAVRELAAWREKAPEEARLAALKSAADAAEEARARAERELIELRRIEAGVEGELKSDRADDVEPRVRELEEACAGAQARVAALEAEIGALQLLSRELDAAASESHDRFTQPVVARLKPYLDLVFPDARARFADGLALYAVERGGDVERVGVLSEGTQEQLAVLVRLGLGRLLAETGTPAPLILDDALVYADDARIERMFEALKLAAQSHQVLVLTCRARTFERLGGHRIAIGAWRER